MKFPETGRAWDTLNAEMEAYAVGDIDWRRGRTPLYVFYATDEVYEVGRTAFMKYFTENALGSKRAFFSVARMEHEVVEMALDLLHGGDDATGHMTSGGSESIFLAVKTAREWFRATRRASASARLNMVLPHTAHPAFNKAAEAMDLEVRRVSTGADKRADVAAMAQAIDSCTFFVAGSAPCFPHGVIDPVANLGELAEERGTWLHVDACVGGYLIPFVARGWHELPAFDFTVRGVRSISADLHKYGFCPKPASTVFYRNTEDFERGVFDFIDWPNGRFTTPTLTGTRPAGAVAAAWAVMNYLGADGYTEIARELMATRDAYVRGLAQLDGFELVASPDLTIINFTMEDGDVFVVAEQLSEKGWLVGLTQQPKGLHLMLSMKHVQAREEYLGDLQQCAEHARNTGRDSNLSATY